MIAAVRRLETGVNEDRQVPLSQDAALVATLAGTALPFAHSAEDEAERWLRAMRLHGQVGTALQALGVGEASLMTGSEPVGEDPAGRPPLGPAVVDHVMALAGRFAKTRGAEVAGTVDLLFAVMDSYEMLFDRALYVRGTSREELLERLTHVGDRATNSF
jgi:hypothetical protein